MSRWNEPTEAQLRALAELEKIGVKRHRRLEKTDRALAAHGWVKSKFHRSDGLSTLARFSRRKFRARKTRTEETDAHA